MMRRLLLFSLAFLGACAGMTAGQTTGAVAASLPPLLAILDSWQQAGLLTPEQYAEMRATFGMFGQSFQSILELVRIWGTRTSEVQAGALSSADVAAISTGVTMAGGAVLHSIRNHTRAKALGKKEGV